VAAPAVPENRRAGNDDTVPIRATGGQTDRAHIVGRSRHTRRRGRPHRLPAAHAQLPGAPRRRHLAVL